MNNGFTGSRKYEPVGIVHEGEGLLACKCGGQVWVTHSGELVNHSEPLDYEGEHIVVSPWTESIWRYEFVG